MIDRGRCRPPNGRSTRIESKSEGAGVGTDRKVTATPVLRTGTKTATCCSLHHWAVTRGAMGRLECSSVRSWRTNVPCGSSRDPAQQFAQHDRAATAKNEHRPGLPGQSVDELVNLRIGHIPHLLRISCHARSAFARDDNSPAFQSYLFSAKGAAFIRSLPRREFGKKASPAGAGRFIPAPICVGLTTNP